MKIGFFGGTFDPFHKGHIAVLKAADESLIFDVIYVVPSANPPHKTSEDVSFATYRYEMAKLGLLNYSFKTKVIVSDIEMEETKKSYTINTISKLKQLNGDCQIYIIGGTDVLLNIMSWYKPVELISNVSLFIIKRPGYEDENAKNEANKLQNDYGIKIKYVESKLLDVSSSELKLVFSKKEKASFDFIETNVNDFINENKLYDSTYSLSDLTKNTKKQLMHYEAMLRKDLSTDRLLHSLNTMRQAVYLARIFDEDINLCAVTGILHDCAKHKGAQKKISDLIEKKVLSNEKLYPNIPPEIRHAYWGKIIAKHYYGINDNRILNAIYYHTTSWANPSKLDMITFVADKIEPSRRFQRIEQIRDIACENLNQGHYECLKDIIKVLEKNGKEIHSDTIEAYNINNK